jgi:hypothetical protein
MARRGWIEFFHQKGYLDKLNRIVWTLEPGRHHSSFSFDHLLAVASCGGESAGSSSFDIHTELCCCGFLRGPSGADSYPMPSAGIAGRPSTCCCGQFSYADCSWEHPQCLLPSAGASPHTADGTSAVPEHVAISIAVGTINKEVDRGNSFIDECSGPPEGFDCVG